MSLQENRQKIDMEYVHFAIKLKNSLALQKDSEIIAKLGVEFDDFVFMVFCPAVFKLSKVMKNLLYIYLVGNV